jgi:hypothetical protein
LYRVLPKDTLHSGSRYAMSLGDLAKALAILPVVLDGEIIQHQRISADVLAFKTSAPHAGAHSLDDQVAFQFSDSADDDDDGPAQWATSIDIFPEADVLDFQPVQLIQHFEEVFHRSGDPTCALKPSGNATLA